MKVTLFVLAASLALISGKPAPNADHGKGLGGSRVSLVEVIVVIMVGHPETSITSFTCLTKQLEKLPLTLIANSACIPPCSSRQCLYKAFSSFFSLQAALCSPPRVHPFLPDSP